MKTFTCKFSVMSLFIAILGTASVTATAGVVCKCGDAYSIRLGKCYEVVAKNVESKYRSDKGCSSLGGDTYDKEYTQCLKTYKPQQGE
ncbi:hypothetical protein Thini_1426 [Thiothrix nivea DSM 5205]|uniref:Secreted protein n=1 Tax=Thiothrix nivea (strain ATCC 35100 / DSM 5205 / JP2) TaxID=870187 RepID=A0A656HFR7_THINJ|nr:hypothetical protein Thini_1426 [Thiothrix nivea DSM 5205]